MLLSPGNKGGRPSSYRLEYATTKFDEYMALCEKGHNPTLIPTQSSYIVIHNANLPSMEGYAEFIGVSDDSLGNWAGKYWLFARAMDRLKSIQRTFLINNGLSGRYNATIAKLMLGVNHGLIERKEVDSGHKMLGIVRMIYEGADKTEREEREKKVRLADVSDATLKQ